MAQIPTALALIGRSEPRLSAHGLRIAGFLDVSMRFSLDEAVASGIPMLLERVLSREMATVEPLGLHHWVWTTLQTVIQSPFASLPLVQCLVKFVHPGRSLWDAVTWTVSAKNTQLTEWLFTEATKRHDGASQVIQDALLREAVRTDDVAMVQWVLQHRVPSKSRSSKPVDLSFVVKGVATATATDTKWIIIEILLENLGSLAHRSLPLLAAQQGRLETLKKFQNHRVPLGVAVANAAAAHGHFDIVQFVGIKPTSDAIDDAAMSGDLRIVQQLHTRYLCELTIIGVLRAADNGHLGVLEWAYKTSPNQPFWTDLAGLLLPAFTAAVDSGRLDVVEWLYETHLKTLLVNQSERRIVKTETVYLAFQRNHIEVIKFLHAHGLMDWDHWEGGNAAYYCDLPTILWLQENNLMGEPRNELTSAVAAGRYDCIQWILENRPLEDTTYGVEYAALHGRMDVVELLLAKGVKGSARAIDYAAGKGHLEVIRRLVDHRRNVDTTNTTDEASNVAIHGACLGGHLEVVRFLTEHPVRGGSCTTQAMDSAASKGFVDVVQYLHEHRTEGCTIAAMDVAATNGDMKVVQYLHKQRTEGCSSAALEGAAVNGHFEMVKFLVATYPHTYTPQIAQRARAKGELEIALWLEQCRAAGVAMSLPRRPSCSITNEQVLPPATPIVG